MSDELPSSGARPDIVPVSDLLDNVASGEIRVPRFQRPYVWTPDDMVQLFDSVLRGYPIGTMLLWQTSRSDISSLERIGPIVLPSTGPQMKSYVVDGHQRLATLLGVLRLPESYPRDKLEDWRWWIGYDLRSEQFVHIKERNSAVPLHVLPLRSVLRTVDFARRTRELAGSSSFDETEIEALLDRADTVQKRIREYRVPMTVIRSASLDDAVTIFARVNQRGRDMTPDQMVSALTFRDRGEGDFDLASSIDAILGAIRALGFGDLQRRIVLQIVLALAGMDFTRPSYERIVDRESHGQMRPAIDSAERALRASIDFLRSRVHLRTSRLLPYASIIVMLCIYFDEAQRAPPPVDKGTSDTEEGEMLTRWFWATSFNGWFAGANTTDLRRAGELMREVARRGRAVRDEFRDFFHRPIRAFPQTYDRRSARVRASLLVQSIKRRPLDPHTALAIDVSDIFADAAARDIPYFFPSQRRPTVSSPANRVVLPDGYPRSARMEFVGIAPGEQKTEILSSHYISPAAYDALVSENFELFIRLREEALLSAEEEFLRDLGLEMNPEAERNSEEIDADE